MSPRCVICDAISRMIQTPLDEEFFEFIRITEAEDAVSWNCKAHEPVLIAANLHDNGLINRGNVSFSKNAGAPIFFVDNSSLHLVRRDDVPNHHGMGRIISDPAWIDMDLIKGFLDNCKRQHGELCDDFPFRHELASAHMPRPSFLIDLHASCIVPGSRVSVDKPFVSLSYVRRNSDAQKYLSLTKANFQALQQPGALTEAALEHLDPSRTIPSTFRDAMRLVALLGIQYLWVDRLCITQDDGPAKELEKSKTAYIAAGAAFVVAECDGADASHGIRGVPGSRPRSFAQQFYPFGEGEAFIRSTGSQRDLMLSRMDSTHVYPLQARSRGETATARRVLRFKMGTVQWACQSCPSWAAGDTDVVMGRMQVDDHMWESCAHECSKERWGCPMDKPRWKQSVGRENEQGDEDTEPPNLSALPWTTALAEAGPPVRQYYAMLAELSQLKTQDPEEDVFDATTGLVAAFRRHFPGRMISGLPESCFDLAMLWRIPAKSIRNPKRPSWAWAGWKHNPDDKYPWGLLPAPEVDGTGHMVAKEYASVEIIPLTTWFVGGLPQSSVQDRLQLDSMRWHEAREAFRDPRADLPPGWIRVENGDLDELVKMGAPRGYDANRAVARLQETPEGKTKSPLFWYPVPVQDGDLEHRPEQLALSEPVRYLFAALDISREGFYVHCADWPSQSHDQFVTQVTRQGGRSLPGTQVLRDTDGKIAGVLDVHVPDHESMFHGGAKAPERASVELVAISRGQTRQLNGPYPECEARPEWRDFNNKGWYEFYNVIWVKWRVEDDALGAQIKVAERRGIGRVFRDVWEEAQKDTEDIVLG